MAGTILLVEDDRSQRMHTAALLEVIGYRTAEVNNGRDALSFLEQNSRVFIDLILLDLNMPSLNGLDVLEIIQQKYPALPVVVLTGSTDIHDVVKAMRLDAIDFLNKPPEVEHLNIALKNALKISTLSREVSRLKRQQSGTTVFDDLTGHNGGLSSVVNIARKAAHSDIPVLITGETGVGKELFARAIHGESERVRSSFIAVNCGAIPSQLVESTLFGHEKGAFTGATEKAAGKFREADGGTIFLDEVGELPLEAQVKLLRVLQQKEIEPVGASKPVPVNIRIISATNRDLQDEVSEGRFREDLYFRLNVLNLHVPPLRERKSDILPLVHHFVQRFAASENRPLKSLSKHAREFLLSHPWHGNVRELENVIHRVIVLSDNDLIEIDDLSYILLQSNKRDSKIDIQSKEITPTGPYTIMALSPDGSIKTINALEKEAMLIALYHHNNNVTQAARSLGIAKSTFYKKMKLHGIDDSQ